MLRSCTHTVLLLIGIALVPVTPFAGERHECLLEPWKIVRLGARSTGVLEELLIDRGDQVHMGQKVASLNSEVERASVALAEARADSTVQIELAEARAELERLSRLRNEALFKRKVISSQQMDEATAAFMIATLTVEGAEYEKMMAGLEHQRVLAFHDLKTIRTPINGIVISTNRTEGEYLSEGDHVATIAQIDPIRAEAFLPLEMLSLVGVGDEVRIYLQDPVGGEFTGVVDVVDRVVDARSGTVGIRVRIDNPEKLTLAGMRCDMAF